MIPVNPGKLATAAGRTFLVFISLVALAATAEIDVRDADRDMFPSDVHYDPSVPTPAAFLGHELGAEPVRHHKLVDYITQLAEASPRLSVETIGYSHERRPILFVIATSENNRANLAEIRERHVALSEPNSDQAITDDMPIVTWINYGVHGAESSGMDAALPFIYHLAAAEDEGLDTLLENSVMLITAIFNPDGHAQRVAWLDAWGGVNDVTDPAHIEHTFSWTFARTNHYGFDLNRQWLLLTQPEPRAWMKKWHEWRPNLTVDYHEMGSQQTYYFHPGVATRTNPLVPDEAERLMAETARTSQRFLDSEARLYFHGERFDNYYVGKGSTFPLVNGGVGVLYEAGAALGREIETESGLRTYRENIRKQFRTSIAAAEAAVALRGDYLRYQRRFYETALSEARRQSAQAWVVAAADDPTRLGLFADLLQQHRIDVFRATRDVDIDGKQYTANETLVIPLNQPQYRLIRSIFETQREFEDRTFYDVSTWTLPPAFGLASAQVGGRDFNGLSGAAWSPSSAEAAEPDVAPYGYLLSWSDYFAPRALYRLQDAELLTRVATEPFATTTTNGDIEMPRGSIFVPFDRQTVSRDAIHELVSRIASEDNVSVHALASGRSAIGTAGIDLGGPSFRPLKKPSVLLVMGDDISLYDAGEVWHLLDHRMNMPLTIRERDDLASIRWNRYTHIVLPSGEFDEFEPDWLPRLRQWIEEGGTLVAMRDAAPWARANTIDWIDPESEDALAETEATSQDEEAEEEEPVERSRYADKADEEALDVIGGAIFSADLDNTHPLGFGFPDRRIFLHKNTEQPFSAATSPWSTVIEYDENPVYSGYVSDENADSLAGTPALIAERSGAGAVILFADNPNFRGYWYGTNKLFLNSLFFSTVFDAPAED